MVTPIECIPRYFYATIRSRDGLAVLELVLTSCVGVSRLPIILYKARRLAVLVRHPCVTRLVADLVSLLKSPGKSLAISYDLTVTSQTK